MEEKKQNKKKEKKEKERKKEKRKKEKEKDIRDKIIAIMFKPPYPILVLSKGDIHRSSMNYMQVHEINN
jgi:hypothetical protein